MRDRGRTQGRTEANTKDTEVEHRQQRQKVRQSWQRKRHSRGSGTEPEHDKRQGRGTSDAEALRDQEVAKVQRGSSDRQEVNCRSSCGIVEQKVHMPGQPGAEHAEQQKVEQKVEQKAEQKVEQKKRETGEDRGNNNNYKIRQYSIPYNAIMYCNMKFITLNK